MDDLIEEFIREGVEMLDDVEPQLLTLQDGAEPDLEVVNAVFRLFHSFKGGAGFVGLDLIGGLTHAAEQVLDEVREGRIALEAEHIHILVLAVDLLREMLDSLAAGEGEAPFAERVDDIRKRLEAACLGSGVHPAISIQAQAETGANTNTNTDSSASEDLLGPGLDAMLDPELRAELQEAFIEDARDQLDTLESILIELERATAEQRPGYLAEVNRAFHSLKGNARLLELDDLSSLTHICESLVGEVVSGGLPCDAGPLGVLLFQIDAIRASVESLAKSGDGSIPDIADRIATVELTIAPSTTKRVQAEKDEQAAAATSPATPLPDEAIDFDAADSPAPSADSGDALEQGPPLTPSPSEQHQAPKATPAQPAPVRSANSAPAAPKAAIKSSDPQTKSERPKTNQFAARQGLRVDLDKLDQLINLVGELVIAEAMVTRHPLVTSAEDERMEKAVHHLRRVSSDLQDVAMSVRMVPLAQTFKKMVRLVHDLSRKTKKPLDLVIIGEDTEVDKTVAEQIADPLVHIVRNSGDHGIETPEERVAAGKEPLATITIEARHEGDEVWILISDDGRGLNRDKILAKAISRDLVAGDGSDLADDDVYRLIFEPGFSTADQVSDISGRGVGMDVVRRNIEALKGTIDIETNPGQGTTVILRIPLTLAIIDGMLVRVGQSRYTLPLLSIRQTIRPSPDMINVSPGGDELLRLYDEVIPVVRLHRRFDPDGPDRALDQNILVVVEVGRRVAALVVDEVVGQQETVIKGLSDYLGGLPGISGCTILGDGTVSLIVDVAGVLDYFKIPRNRRSVLEHNS